MDDTRKILFSRFRLNHDALEQHKVYVMEFPYHDALDDFLSVIAENPKRKLEKYSFAFSELPPYASLNTTIIASVPQVTQGFEMFDRTHWSTCGYSYRRRRIVAMGIPANGERLHPPSPDDIAYIVAEWAKLWAENTFGNGRFGNELLLHERAGENALQTLIKQIYQCPGTWQEVSASTLWEQQNSRNTDPMTRLAYDALPSILAVLFVQNSKDNPLSISGRKETTTIQNWWLVQHEKKLAVISEPIEWRSGKKSATFSYRIRFDVQTQVGNNDPWIAVDIGIRRWGCAPVASTNYDRDVSVLLRILAPRVEGWAIPNTLVELKTISTGKKNSISDMKWKDDPAVLLNRLKGGRGIADPVEIFADPLAFQTDGLRSTTDQYYIVHAEGMTYQGIKNHHINTGTSLTLRSQILAYIENQLGEYLQPDTAQPVDPKGTLHLKSAGGNEQKSIRGNKITSLFTYYDLKDISLADRGATEAEKQQLRAQITSEALLRASGGRQVRILLFYRGDGGKSGMEHYVHDLLFANADTSLPSNIEIAPAIPISGTLGDAPAKDWREKTKVERDAYINRQWRQKRDAWQQMLQRHVQPDAYHLAFIELDGRSSRICEYDTWLKQAIRNACVHEGINSQMIFTIPPNILNAPMVSDRSRILSGANDLLIRQPALRYETPTQIYVHAGLDSDFAKELTVVGLYRFTANKPLGIDYPLAIVMDPVGITWAILPDKDGHACEPIRYIEAGPVIGRIFAEDNKQLHNYYKENRKNDAGYRFKRFAQEVFELIKGSPCLALVNTNWRQFLPLSNSDLVRNSLNIDNHVYNRVSSPQMRIIRVRQAGSLHETPQYVELKIGDKWKNAQAIDDPESLTGVVDYNSGSDFPHYFSIGRLPDTVSHENDVATFESGDNNTAHRHQQAIELVPFFTQEGDDPFVYCRIAHFLRVIPSWNRGNTSLPYPLHMADRLVRDQLDVFPPRNN